MSGTMQEVDDLLAELNLTEPPRPKQTSVNEDEINSLMREIGIGSGGNPRPASSGPGVAAKKVSSGPGAMARGKISSGPGAKMVSGPPGLPAPQKFATHAPDGRPIQHQGPPCARCKEMIIGQCLNALGKQYHPEHFVCVHCNNPFPPGKQFIEHNGEPYCEADFTELFCPRCAVCKQPVADKAINALGHHYHPNHFNCTGCGRNLVGLVYKEDEGEPYCSSCKEARVRLVTPAAEPCAKCKKPITGEFIVLKGQKMHAEHFRCEECGCEFKGGGCREYEGRLYCNDDYNKLLRNTCGSCHKPILGRSITALGRIWHPEHFVCYTCHEPFAGSNFYEKDGKPYCETHYTQEFGDPCAKCGRPVIHDALHFLDKVYHSDHFCCTGCEKQLKKGDINEWEGKPLCMKCFGKLPSEVRKKIEKKREADAKIAKQREKEEKAKAKAAGKK